MRGRRPRRRADRRPGRARASSWSTTSPKPGGVAAWAPPSASTASRRWTGSSAPPPSWPASPRCVHLQRTTAFGLLRRRLRPRAGAAHRPPRRRSAAQPLAAARLAHPRPSVLVATGAHERPIVFADNDRPGIMLAGAARTFLHRYGVLAGRAAVVFTTNDSAYAAARRPGRRRGRGRARSSTPGREPPAAWARGVREPRHPGAAPGTSSPAPRAPTRVTRALVAPARDGAPGGSDAHRVRPAAGQRRLEPGGAPVQPGGRQAALRRRARRVRPGRAARQASTVAGSAAGVFDLAGCLADGRRAAARRWPSSASRGRRATTRLPPPTGPRARRTAVLWRVPDTPAPPARTQFVDLQRDATVADIARADRRRACARSSTSSATRPLGTAHDQGKTSGVIASGIVAELLGVPTSTTSAPPRSGRRTPRSPSPRWPDATAGALYDPERITAAARLARRARRACSRTSASGSARWYYPQPGEDMEAAVLRECARRPRPVSAFMDGSTLGKIDVQGPDAADVPGPALHQHDEQPQGRLDPLRRDVRHRRHGPRRRHRAPARPRTGSWSPPPPATRPASWTGWRSGCRPSGRTCGCTCTSVTEQWATVRRSSAPLPRRARPRVPGTGTSQRRRSRSWRGGTPRSADVAGAGGPDQLLRRAGLRGQRRRLARASRCGSAWSRRASPYGITPYGTETMHVLRAEKAYPIIGQDTDGTVTPQDLGMAGRCRRRRPTSSASGRSPAPDNNRPDRKHLVGLLPGGPHGRCCPRARRSSSRHRAAARRRCPCSGTSPPATAARRWAGRFALALVKAGRTRIGQTVHVPVAGDARPRRDHRPVLVDPEGARRDG